MASVKPSSRRRRIPSPEGLDLGRAAECLARVNRLLDSSAAVADLLDVNCAQPRRWRESQRAHPENGDRTIGLDSVLALLSGFLGDSSIPQWLTGVNAHLDNRHPTRVPREGRIADVIAAIEAQKGGLCMNPGPL